MNREEKRKVTKKLKSKGYTLDRINTYISYREKLESSIILSEGDLVRIDINRIKEHPDYSKLSEKYKAFIANNTGREFTVEYDKNHTNNPTLVCLKEDTTDPKWLFWTGDLIKEDK
jgi:ABC-type tungstate transport system permease subunit